ncbi:MutS N-terminal domain-containing protein [Niallia endozanthoxylica]|uniref:DNA mismatch repair protein MutS-like N-terminal domain-containing protein n=1 Tax=Niallia endozanthoxylica TaxID=2036016 RepID=A0A5J5HQD9_9BACI|nr:hypothetical protein [Niallia endozanthoxylica]KAA9023909.1 hypothetical protein F4V44_12290 [Niallia endozanthoxylica]
MHHGDEVYITRTGKYYHYFDDDCPTTARILKGTTAARKVKEEEAKRMGYTLCRHCSKEYAEDLAERQGCGGVAMLLLAAGIGASSIFKFFT